MDESLAKRGRFGDILIRNVNGEPSHVSRLEAELIDSLGKEGEGIVSRLGSGTINPKTGMREYFMGWVMGALLVTALASMQTNKFQNWGGLNPFTTPYKSRYSARSKMMEKGLTGFEDLKDFYGKKGKFEGLGDIGGAIKDLRYHRGGYGLQEKTGSTWNALLGGGLEAFRNFNPLKALKEKLSPFIKGEQRKKSQGLDEARLKLGELSKGIDVGGVNVGQIKDIFKLGATAQGKGDEFMAANVAEKSKQSGDEIFQEWIGML
tara:strand:+ start:7786 stop:8574 length:789 start_codon:yes stop_codon:yes gene_type:complete